MNHFSFSAFKCIVADLKKRIVGCKINNITVINSHDFVCTLSMIKEEKLLISLNHQQPFLSLIKVKENTPTMTGSLNESLRKLLKEAYIVDINLDHDDRVVHLITQKANDYYEKVVTDVYLECIPQRANLIFVNAEGLIIHALHYSSLASNRSVLNGLHFDYPAHQAFINKEEEVDLLKIKDEAEKYYENALLVHKKEKFTPLYRYMKTRIRSLEKKSLVLQREIAEAQSHLNDAEHGNYLLAYQYEKEELDAYLKVNHIIIPNDTTVVAFANQLFKKYKKSKRTIEMAELEIKKAHEESDYLSYLLSSSSFMNDDELLALSQELLPKQNLKKKPAPIKSSYIIYQGVKISFGKNASSNQELTFKIAKKDDYYLHIKDYHGAHVIIHDSNPNNEVILLAAELCLILSNKKAGEVMMAEMKNVKKGHALGEALLSTYRLIVLNEIRESSYLLLANKENNH